MNKSFLQTRESSATLATIDASESSTEAPSESSSVTSSSSSSSTLWQHDVSADEEIIVEPHVGYKKVLVTGGAGFIGSNVAEYLLQRGDDVVIVDEMNDYYDPQIKEANLKSLTDVYGTNSNRLKIYKGDICDETFMTNLFEQEHPEWVCHMAARAGVRPSIQDPYIYIHSNIKVRLSSSCFC